MMNVKKGDTVKIEYTGTLEDGTVFDSSEKHNHPLVFEAGAGMVIPGFDNAVIGMKKGEDKEVKISPEQGYGPQRPELVRKFPRDKLPKDAEVKPGMILGVSLPTGQQLPAIVTEANEKEVTLDLNHPLAGKALNFKIKVIGINEPGDKTECSCGCHE